MTPGVKKNLVLAFQDSPTVCPTLTTVVTAEHWNLGRMCSGSLRKLVPQHFCCQTSGMLQMVITEVEKKLPFDLMGKILIKMSII